MKIQITSWCDNSVLFEADCDTLKLAIGKAVTANANLHDADLHGANLHDADLHGANLHGADLSGANLHGADLSGANLHGADLSGANLHDADLHGADLSGANLHDADLHGANVIDAGHSRNGYRFAGIKQEAGYKVKGGCHFFTPKEALEYWSGKQDRLEALAACTYIAAVAKIRGWV
jgi:uncharacterized protein YjbI with pentapeptide repeats